MSVHAGIDPLAACANGRYLDELVLVERGERRGLIARARPDGGVLVRHRLDPAELDDDLADRLAVTLAPLTDDHEVFARAFTGIVLTSAPDPLIAWERFYRNSLARIDRRPGYSEIYQHALALLPTTTVLDIGAGFGFLSLHLAERGAEVIACDVDPGTVRLVRTMSARLGRPLEVLCCDGASVPLPAECVDAVALLHVLEHLDHDAADAVLAEALRPARHRVVVAVPYEGVPNPLFGHVRGIICQDLADLGARSGWSFDVHDHYGGWLVLDRTHAPTRSSARTVGPSKRRKSS